jgi:ElaB/YqjD/DUF883 family membrane-anchored ribosome-binding protein
MSTTMNNAYEKVEDAMTQIARLRDQVETLMRDKATPIMAAARRIDGATHDAADIVRGRADQLADLVRENPLTAIGVAAIVGFLFGRVGR